MYHITARACSINAFAQGDPYIRSWVEREWNRTFERALLPELSPSALKCLLAIKSRTLGWMKYAEAIPISHFVNGMVDRFGCARLDEGGRPLFAGSGIAKEDTVRSALKTLDQAGLITKMVGSADPGTGANIYMPFQRSGWHGR